MIEASQSRLIAIADAATSPSTKHVNQV